MRRAAPVRILGALLAAGAVGANAQPAGDCAGVYWDLTALFASGDRIYARVLLTREGPGGRLAAGQGHWLAPEGLATPFQNGRREGRFTSEAGGRRLRIGSTELDVTGDAHRFAVDNDKRGVKLEVALETATPIAVSGGDLAIAVLHLGSAAKARVWRRGMTAPRSLRGHATLVRTTHTVCERELAALRVDVHRLTSDHSALLIHERLASGEERSWLGWRDGAGAVRTTRPERVVVGGWRAVAGGDRLPRWLRPKGHGLGGEITLDDPHLARDPLDALPALARMLYWFGASPRRVWADATLALEPSGSGPGDLPPRGPALASFTFLRPPSP